MLRLLPLFLFFIPIFSLAQGSTCTNAVEVTIGTFNADGPSSGGGANQPDAQNADWYQFTPASNGLVSISSCNGGADTRLFLYQGSCADLQQVTASDDACSDGGNQDVASQITDEPVEGGVTYYIEWDDRWSDAGFTWSLSFTGTNIDAGITDNKIAFTQLPQSQSLPLSVDVASTGTAAVNNLIATAEIFTLSDLVNPVASFSSPAISNLAPGTTTTIEIGTWANAIPNDYRIQFSIASDNDQVPDNDIDEVDITISDVVYAIDDDNRVGGVGITTAGTTIRLGQEYSIYTMDTITSISAFINGGNAGDVVFAELYLVMGEMVGGLITTSANQTLPSAAPGWVHFKLPEPLVIAGNMQIMASIGHVSTGTNLQLGVTTERYVFHKARLAVNDGPWSFLDDPPNNEELVYMIRINTGTRPQQLIAQVDMSEQIVEDVNLVIVQDGNILSSVEATDQGNGIYQAIFNANSLDTVSYFWSNGPIENASNFEEVPDECGQLNASLNRNVRSVNVGFEDILLPRVCFNRCGECLLARTIQVSVDMSLETVSPDGVQVAYARRGGEPVIIPMVAVEPQIYIANIPAVSGDTIGYFFINGTGDAPEQFEEVPNECGVDSGTNFDINVRPLIVGLADTIINTVCFGSCSNCPASDCDNPVVLINDDVESYSTGEITTQSSDWIIFPGFGAGGLVSSEIPENNGSTTQSIKLDGNIGNQDLILQLGPTPDRHYLIQFDLFVPEAGFAYFNVLHELNPVVGAFDVFFNDDQSGELVLQDQGPIPFVYPQETWIPILIIIDIENDVARLFVNEVVVASWPFSTAYDVNANTTSSEQLFGVNFFPINPNFIFYVDNVEVLEIPPAVLGQYCYTALPVQPGIINTPGISCFGGPTSRGSLRRGLGAAWYTYTPTTDGVISVSSCASGLDTRVFIFEGDCYDFNGLNGVSDDQCEGINGEEVSSYREAVVEAGRTYYIAWVDRFNDDTFNWELTFTTDTPTPGNFCESAIDVPPGITTVDTIDGYAAWTNGSFTDGVLDHPFVNSEWYQYNPLEDGTVDISSCFGGEDTRLHVYTGNCRELVQIGQNEDACAIAMESQDTLAAALFGVEVNGGQTYYIEWTNPWSSSSFDFSIDFAVSTAETELDLSWQLYPNPTSGNVQIQYTFDQATSLRLRIINSMGQILEEQLHQVQNVGSMELNLNNYPKGAYWIQLFEGDNQSVRKLIRL